MTFKVKRGGFMRRQWRFVMVGGNGEPIGTSELYHNQADCYDTIDLIKETAHTAPVVAA